MRQHTWALAALMSLTVSSGGSLLAGPIVVPTAEGQIGEMPGVDDKVLGPMRAESIRGGDGDLVFGGVFVTGGALPPPPEVRFFTDQIHGASNPVQVSATASLFASVDKVTPDSAWSRNAADDGDFVAFSFAVDGSMPQTMTVRIATFDETGSQTIEVPIIEDVETFAFPEPTFAKTGVGVDDQGRATVVYTEFSAGLPSIKGLRLDAEGNVIDPGISITDAPFALPDVALLDAAGNRLIVASNELVNPAGVFGNIVDFTGQTPTVGPAFPFNSTPIALIDINPVVAADPATGNFTAVWERFEDIPGNPVDIRARRFDAMGNPIGDDFVVNSIIANAQGQQTVAYGLEGLSAIAWAGDPETPQGPGDLDVFLQVYDAMGNPIDGEIRVNTFTADVQDRPAVRFLPERDNFGRPQVLVAWRDVATADGAGPRGTGASYKCFSVNGFDEQVPIFEDGFESGDTSSWSDSQP